MVENREDSSVMVLRSTTEVGGLRDTGRCPGAGTRTAPAGASRVPALTRSFPSPPVPAGTGGRSEES